MPGRLVTSDGVLVLSGRLSPIERIFVEAEARTVFRVELGVPAAVLCHERIFHRLGEDRLAGVALVIPDHDVPFKLKHIPHIDISLIIIAHLYPR